MGAEYTRALPGVPTAKATLPGFEVLNADVGRVADDRVRHPQLHRAGDVQVVGRERNGAVLAQLAHLLGEVIVDGFQ